MLVAFAAGQTASGPVLGWTLALDGRSVHAIHGVPGASRLAPAASLPGDLQTVKLNPNLNVALALAGDSAVPVILDLNTLERTALLQARPGPGLMVWSPSGSALALLYPSAQWVQIFTMRSGSFQLGSEFSAASNQVAVADDGSALLAATPAGLSLYQGGSAGVLSASPAAAFTFLAGGAVPAWWADGRLTIGSQSVPFTVDEGDTLFLASPSRARLVAVRAAAGRVTTLDSAGQTVADAFCNCLVSGLDSLGRPGAILLKAAGVGPLWVADNAAAPRLFFVPVAPSHPVDDHRRVR
jgi:hypothetical protein